MINPSGFRRIEFLLCFPECPLLTAPYFVNAPVTRGAPSSALSALPCIPLTLFYPISDWLAPDLVAPEVGDFPFGSPPPPLPRLIGFSMDFRSTVCDNHWSKPFCFCLVMYPRVYPQFFPTRSAEPPCLFGCSRWHVPFICRNSAFPCLFSGLSQFFSRNPLCLLGGSRHFAIRPLPKAYNSSSHGRFVHCTQIPPPLFPPSFFVFDSLFSSTQSSFLFSLFLCLFRCLVFPFPTPRLIGFPFVPITLYSSIAVSEALSSSSYPLGLRQLAFFSPSLVPCGFF